MYVWFDALTNYITGVGFPDESEANWKYWPADVHVIGKDIIRFHAVFWPAFLMSAGVPLPKRVYAHGFLFNRGEKMSKSVGNVVDPFNLADQYGVDQVRYFFLREVPFGQDGNYNHEAIVARINADLANDLGNLAQRSLSMIGKQLGGVRAGAGRVQRQRQGHPGSGRRHDRAGARSDEDAADPSGAECGLRGRRRSQPLFRGRGAVGARQDRSGAAEDGALRDGGGHPPDRRSVPAVHAGGVGESCSTCWRCLQDARTSRRSPDRLKPGSQLPPPAPVFPRYVEPKETRGGVMLVDSHCHLDFPDFADDLDAIVQRAEAAGIGRIVTISTRVRRLHGLLDIAARFPNVYCSVGTHPHHADEEDGIPAQELIELTKHPKVVALGEAGLDYFYKNGSPRGAGAGLSRPHRQLRARPDCRW